MIAMQRNRVRSEEVVSADRPARPAASIIARR
jgi:hypothetical protein